LSKELSLRKVVLLKAATATGSVLLRFKLPFGVMKNLLRFIAFVLMVGGAHAQINLPACRGSDVSKWNKCVGTATFSSGNKYAGDYKNGKRNGFGVYTFTNGNKYVGEFKDNKRNGQGTLNFANGNKYVGEFKDDKINGQGTETFASGSKYVGEFKDTSTTVKALRSL
jgi:hypothetical protein